MDGRRRLLPAFVSMSLGSITSEDVRAMTAEFAESVAAGEVSPKTVNNTLDTLVVCLAAGSVVQAASLCA